MERRLDRTLDYDTNYYIPIFEVDKKRMFETDNVDVMVSRFCNESETELKQKLEGDGRDYLPISLIAIGETSAHVALKDGEVKKD